MTAGSDHPVINPRNYDDFLFVVEAIRSQIGKETAIAEIGIICGSGLGPIGDAIVNPTILPYEKIPGFMKTKVPGHKGNLIFGTLSGKKVIVLQGRFHAYEHAMNLALDHISFPMISGFSPLVGVSDRRFGEQFVSLHQLYDKELRKLAHNVADTLPLVLHEGILSQTAGPQYETPAEVSALKTMGVDCVGMSVAHEATVAKQCSMRVLAFCLITNKANTDADSSELVSHLEVLEAANKGGELATTFVTELLKKL